MTRPEETKTDIINRLRENARKISEVLNKSNLGFLFTPQGYVDPGVGMVLTYTLAILAVVFTNIPTFWVLVIIVVFSLVLGFVPWKRLASRFIS